MEAGEAAAVFLTVQRAVAVVVVERIPRRSELPSLPHQAMRCPLGQQALLDRQGLRKKGPALEEAVAILISLMHPL